jgi:uncharacterized repeat protein (TIGR03803 family)
VFKVNTDGTDYAVLKSFSALSAPVDGTNSDGASPSAGLVISGGVLYGTASGGGAFGQGTMFRMNTDGSGYTVLKDFTGDGGGGPQGELTLSSGVLYGTTSYEISSGNGTVFKVNTNGTGYTVLKTFSATGYDPSTGSYTNSDGARPRAGLTLSGSALFGTTPGGGISGNGTVFQVNTDGTGYTVLKSFNAATYDISTGTYTNEDGANPEAGLMLSGGVLYGTTYQGGASGGGTLFKMNTDGTGYAVLKHCTFGDGRFPLAGLTLVGGVLYGAMSASGGGSGVGTVFKVNTDGTEYSLLKVFTNSPDGAYPGADLTYSGGVLYGTTGSGGEMGLGTVFKLQLPTALRGYLSIQPDGGGGMFITINGSPGLTYRLQRASALAGPWNTSAPQTAPASGLVEFHDLFPPPGQAFYRAVQP